MFTSVDELGWKQSNAFKKAFSVDAKIDFIGVWLVASSLCKPISFSNFSDRDTVNSVGLIPRRLPFTTSNTIVRTFRHAVALDERRAKFKANLWNRPNNKEQTLGTDAPKPEHAKKHQKPQKKLTLKTMERKYSEENEPTDIEEVGTFTFSLFTHA
jgi:hypothetical protein